MKTVVEFGYPASVLPDRKIGIDAFHVLDSMIDAAKLGASIAYILSRGDSIDYLALAVTRASPRRVVWGKNREFWVAVSLLDGVDRGSYASTVRE